MNRNIEPLSISETALLAIDFQRESAPGQRWAVQGYDQMLKAAVPIFAAARKNGVNVIHVRTMRREGADVPVLEPRLSGKAVLYGDARSPASEFIPELKPQGSEIVVEKTRSSGFADGRLEAVLQERRITDLVVAGVWTEECVLLTVKAAIGLGFRVWLAAEACASGSCATHQAIVAIMAMRLYGGGVVGTSNAVACLEGRAFSAFRPDLPDPLLTSHSDVDRLFKTMIQAQ